MRPMRTAPTGPRNGSGEMASAAEAPLIARMSCGTTMSAERTVQITCTSFLKPFGQSGRIGRSIIRAVSVARSVARPSRLKKPPGILPAAYIRSSTSTVKGKKSASGRASCRPTAVARIIVSPLRTTTAPSACFASLPVSKRSSFAPTSTDTVACCPVLMVLIPCSFLPLFRFGGRWRFEPTPRRLPRDARSNAHLPSPSRLAPRLTAETELLDEGPIALEVLALQVVEEPPPPADQLQEAAPRVVVFRVRPEVLGELVDPPREHRHLDLGRAGVLGVLTVLLDQLLLGFLGESHVSPLVNTSPRSPHAVKEEHGRPRSRSAGHGTCHACRFGLRFGCCASETRSSRASSARGRTGC